MGKEGEIMASTKMVEILRRRLRADKRPLLQIAQAAGLPYPVVHHFASGKRGLQLVSAAKLAAALGMELRPRKAGGNRGKSC